MAFVLFDNLPAGTDADDVAELLSSVGADTPLAIELAPGLGEFVAATCVWAEESYARAVANHMHGMVWHGRVLSADYLPSAPA